MVHLVLRHQKPGSFPLAQRDLGQSHSAHTCKAPVPTSATKTRPQRPGWATASIYSDLHPARPNAGHRSHRLVVLPLPCCFISWPPSRPIFQTTNTFLAGKIGLPRHHCLLYGRPNPDHADRPICLPATAGEAACWDRSRTAAVGHNARHFAHADISVLVCLDGTAGRALDGLACCGCLLRTCDQHNLCKNFFTLFCDVAMTIVFGYSVI